MDIKINGQTLDVTLENEKTAYDIIDSIIHELNGKDSIISSIEIDGHFYSLDDEGLKSISIDNIKFINIEIAKKEELVISLLDECKNMLFNISGDMKKNGFSHSKEFNDLFQWVIETIDSINQISQFKMVEAKLLISTINQIIDYLNGDQKELSKIETLTSIIENLVTYLDAIQLKISTNFSVSKDQVTESINGCVELLPEISEAFQMGRDKEALSKINTVISVLEMCCIYLRKNLSGFSSSERDEIDGLYNEINALLSRIVEAFENGDVVLLGDLLEYELPDKLESYKNIILS